MKKIGLFYGSTMGNTEGVARIIGKELSADIFDVSNASKGDLDSYEMLILGTSTWGLGDLQDDWEGFISELQAVDLTGKTVAIFGLGDAEGYPDTFVDGIGTLYEAVSSQGATVIGSVPVVDYSYDASTAEVDGLFVGLPLDEDNESDKTQARLDAWLVDIKAVL